MNLNKSLLILVFFIIGSCADITFVHNNKHIESILLSQTSLVINGDNKNTINLLLGEKIKNSVDGKYKLEITSSKKEANLITESNQVATVIKIQYKIIYKLELVERNCLFLHKQFVTEATYNSKSAGYSFGSDLSKSKINEETIENNIEKFLNYVSNNSNDMRCGD